MNKGIIIIIIIINPKNKGKWNLNHNYNCTQASTLNNFLESSLNVEVI